MAVIDIGSPAIDRDSLFHPAIHTAVNKDNPANEAGTITKVQIWANSAMTSVKIGIFFVVSGNNLSTRSWQAVSDLSIGFNEVDVSLACEAGDYIGIEYATGSPDRSASGYAGTWATATYDIPCTNVTFTPGAGDTGSIYGIGATPAPPDPPTNVQASDGTYTDKVRVTWDASDGALGYWVWDGDEWIDAGDVLTWDDFNAPAPTITPGTASASDGTSSDYVTLSVAGESANNGSSITYYVVAYNAAGNSGNSDPDNGYRGVGALAYRWQRSAADSDADYSDIPGGTTDPYNDTEAPEDGSGRYYKCGLDANGATPQTTNADRGYRLVAGIKWNGVTISKWNGVVITKLN